MTWGFSQNELQIMFGSLFSLQATKLSCQVTKKSGFFAILQRFWLHFWKKKDIVVIPTTYVRAKRSFFDHTKQVLLVTLINSSFQVQILQYLSELWKWIFWPTYLIFNFRKNAIFFIKSQSWINPVITIIDHNFGVQISAFWPFKTNLYAQIYLLNFRKNAFFY